MSAYEFHQRRSLIIHLYRTLLQQLLLKLSPAASDLIPFRFLRDQKLTLIVCNWRRPTQPLRQLLARQARIEQLNFYFAYYLTPLQASSHDLLQSFALSLPVALASVSPGESGCQFHISLHQPAMKAVYFPPGHSRVMRQLAIQ